MQREYNLFLDKIEDGTFNKNSFLNFDPDKERVDRFLLQYIKKEDFPHLFEAAIIVMITSHGQATVERGFAINRNVEAENLKGSTLESKRMICDSVNLKGGLPQFKVSKDLLQYCHSARYKYRAHLDKERETKQSESQKRKHEELKSELDVLKKRLGVVQTTAAEMFKSADEKAVEAEVDNKMSSLSMSNSLRRGAKKKEEEAKALEKEIEEKNRLLREI